MNKISISSWFFSLLVICLSIPSALAEKASANGQVTLYVFEGVKVVRDYQVWVGKDVNISSFNSNANGAVKLTLPLGPQQIAVARDGYQNTVLNLNMTANEQVQVIITQYANNEVPHISIESSNDGKATKDKAKPAQELNEALKNAKPGILKGRVVNSENQSPVVNARIFFSGLATDFLTDEDGYFEAEVPSNSYSISILHTQFASQTLDGIEITANQTTDKTFEVTPAGIALKEFVVVAPFIQGSVSSLVDERKESNVVSDFVGAEQMSKSGDSDAAAALTRMAGLTLIDGKYAVVRGMEDRYTTVLMNGAVMRSPDPNSKSVDLDMFPASILGSIEVQKTYSADAPGSFGGGLIKLRTKALPEEDFVKVKVSAGGNTNVTGKDVISQQSGDTDYLGQDDGSRDNIIPSESNENIAPNEAREFPLRFQTKQETAQPNLGLAVSFGQLFNQSLPMDLQAGIQGYIAYKNKWSYEEGERNSYGASGEVLTQRNDMDYEKSKYSVDTTALFNAAIENDWMSAKSTTALIRKSYRLTRQDYGLDGENGEVLRKYNLEWSERELFSQQFNGQFNFFGNTELDWQYGFSNASLYNPDTLSFRYDDSENPGDSVLSFRDRNAQRRSLELADDNQTLGFDLLAKFNPLSFLKLNLKGGYSFDATQRDSETVLYQYNWIGNSTDSEALFVEQNPDIVLAPENISANGFALTNFTKPSDSYDGEKETTAMYAMVETTWFEDLDLILGMRNESFTQTVNAFDANVGEPLFINQESDDSLPSLLATYRLMDGVQVRIATAETINRASMLELSPSSWIDPLSGDRYQGNPRLKNAEISHFDARLEMYGNGSDSISLAFFTKDFTNPIEKTLEAASGNEEVVTYQNAKSASTSGFEIDFRWDLAFINTGTYLFSVSGNYSSIDSEVVLPDNTTEFSDSRTMQGQSPYTANLMLNMDNDAIGLESALIFNEIGERISRIGQGDVPHVYEQPFTALDLTLSKSFSGSKLSFKLKNLLNEGRLYTQGGEVYQKYEPGMSFNLGYSANF